MQWILRLVDKLQDIVHQDNQIHYSSCMTVCKHVSQTTLINIGYTRLAHPNSWCLLLKGIATRRKAQKMKVEGGALISVDVIKPKTLSTALVLTNSYASSVPVMSFHPSDDVRPVSGVQSMSWLWPVVEFNFDVTSVASDRCRQPQLHTTTINQASARDDSLSSPAPTSDVRVFLNK